MNLSSFRANWSTTVTGGSMALAGFATFVAGFATQLGALGALIPADYRPKILLAGGISTALATALHGALTKSASVSGNGTINEPAKVAQGDGSNKTLAPLLAAALFPAFFFSSCAGTVVKEGGKTVLRTQANASLVDFTTSRSHLHMENVDHSTATLAGGTSTAHIIHASGAALTSLALAATSGGASAPVTSVAGKAAALSLPIFTKPATPAPADLSAH